MKFISVFIFVLISYYSYSQLHSIPPCDCPDDYKPVHTKNGKNFLNECVAKCLTSKNIYRGNADSSLIKTKDTLTWPIHEVCSPHYGQTTLVFAKKEISKETIPDGTLIFNPNSKYHTRGVVKKPCNLRCLPPDAKISTNNGKKTIKLLQVGDTVLSINANNQIISVPIIDKDSIFVGTTHYVLDIELADGRKLEVSAEHPDRNYRLLDNYKKGFELDGSKIIRIDKIKYENDYTYDILPGSATGMYYVNDILLGSTLFYQAIVIE